MVRAADPINLTRTSRRPEQGKWGYERDASPCGRVQDHLAMAQCNSAASVVSVGGDESSAADELDESLLPPHAATAIASVNRCHHRAAIDPT
jgi:hypothetical protein